MAQYKVPQDVEADDKLIGPFSFRQFVYLLIVGGLVALAVGLFQIFPLLAIIPLPPMLLFGALALPLRKDQPMETYLAALVSYYLKPHKRLWTPGQRESTIQITAPKIVETSRARNITGEEATHRLSFLANIVDTQGYAIKGIDSSLMKDDLVAEANATTDMFENNRFDRIEDVIEKEENERHEEVVNNMRRAIQNNEEMTSSFGASMIQKRSDERDDNDDSLMSQVASETELNSPVVVMPETSIREDENRRATSEIVEKTEKKVPQTSSNHSIIELASNPDFSIATIAQEAKRIKERDDSEVFISLR